MEKPHLRERVKQTNNALIVSMGLINKVDIVCLSPVGYGV